MSTSVRTTVIFNNLSEGENLTAFSQFLLCGPSCFFPSFVISLFPQQKMPSTTTLFLSHITSLPSTFPLPAGNGWNTAADCVARISATQRSHTGLYCVQYWGSLNLWWGLSCFLLFLPFFKDTLVSLFCISLSFAASTLTMLAKG